MPAFAWIGGGLCAFAILFTGKPRLATYQPEMDSIQVPNRLALGDPVLESVAAIDGISAESEAQVERGRSDLLVEVSGFSDSQGECLVAVYDNPSAFNKIDQSTVRQTEAVTGDLVRFTVDDVSADSIAIAAFHDQNKNGRLDKNALGIPTEGYGFSNNPVSTFGPPSFETAKVSDWKHATQPIRILLKGLK